MLDNLLKVSPNYALNQAKGIITNLNENSLNHWEEAIKLFKDRINGRYLNVNKILISSDFSDSEPYMEIMSVNCALIECLEQFKNGRKQTKYRGVRDAFISFLTKRTNFKKEFNENYANIFYDNVRNGLLHQAGTKGNVSLSAYYPKIINTKVISGKEYTLFDVIRINEALELEVNEYCNKLMKINNSELRKNFIKKWNFIFRK